MFFKKKLKEIFFIDNINPNRKFKNNKNFNIIISKSGNTLRLFQILIIVNSKKNCLFITENKDSYLKNLAHQLKGEIIDHNNFIGGRYSVLSETGMLPAILMGLNPNKFKQFDYLVKNKNFLNNLILNVNAILAFHNSKNQIQ